MKTILITGGSGFIGKNLIEAFTEKYNVLFPTHKELDLLDTGSVDRFFDENNIDVVIHGALVGGSRKEENEENALTKNLKMFFNIIRNKNKFGKMINFGSGAEYDKSKPIIEARETDFGKTIPIDDYGFFKYISSKFIETQDNIVSLRIFGLFGKYEDYRYRFISNAICQNLAGLPITINQNVFFTYVYIDDFVKIVDYFINHETKSKFFNIGNGGKVDLLMLARIINEVADKKTEIVVKNDGLNNEYTCDNQRLIKEITKFDFIKLEDSITILYNWYKNEKDKLSLQR